MKSKDIIKELFRREEKKYPHPDGYSNLLKCIADYRHIPKKDRFMFNRYGSHFYRCQNPYSKENKHEWYGPSMTYNVGDKEPIPFRVNDTMYAIVVFARDDTSTMVEFEFMRPLLLSKDETEIRVADYFDSISRTAYAVSDPLDEGYLNDTTDRECKLTEQDVAWAITDIIHNLVDVNSDEGRKGLQWRHGLEIIMQYHIMDKKILHKSFKYDGPESIDRNIHSNISIYNVPVCGYLNTVKNVQFKYPISMVEN